MYLSRVRLRPDIRKTQLRHILGKHIYSTHQLLWDLFQSDKRQYLFREEIAEQQLKESIKRRSESIYYVLSSNVPAENALLQVEAKPFQPKLVPGDRLAYKIRVNPVVTRNKQRRYDPKDWSKGDVANQCLSAATSCLYGVTEAAVLAAGYAPAIGFLHCGKPLSFVYDIADIVKFDTVAPVTFKVAAKHPNKPDREVRIACRDVFRSSRLLKRIIPMIEEVLAAGEIEPPPPPEDAQPPAIPEPESIGDDGHRSQ